MDKRIGLQSVCFEKPPAIMSHYSVCGPKEGEGPLAEWFDEILADDLLGQQSYEQAERELYTRCVHNALRIGDIPLDTVDVLLGGDLLNQLVSASFAARTLKVPFIGLYSACSTIAACLLVGGMMVDAQFAARVACATVSHFSSAERQYRQPLECGLQRAPTAQRTVTGAGAFVLAPQMGQVRLEGGTIGRVVDMGVCDPNNMGAAMAPAVADTLATHLADFGRQPEEYDLIVTGDLGRIGSQLLHQLLAERGIELGKRHFDCGERIFATGQNVDAGGSGAGCCAAVLSGYLLKQLQSGRLQRVLFIASGALMSLTTSQQGESIPGIAHAVVLRAQ